MDFESIDDLEEFRENLLDEQLKQDISLHLESYSKGIFDFFVNSTFISSYKMTLIQDGNEKTLQIDTRFIKNLNIFPLEAGDQGQLIILGQRELAILNKK